MIAPLSRILARYTASALVTYGAIAPPDAAFMEPEIALLIGLGIGALTEGVYALAVRFGWAR